VSCCCQAIGSWGGAGTWQEAYYPLLAAATGIDLSPEEVFQSAERVINIERAHWLRDGSGIQDDTHIDRYFDEGVHDGPFKGMVIDREKWAWAQQEYYKRSSDSGLIATRRRLLPCSSPGDSENKTVLNERAVMFVHDRPRDSG
jgi:aldehyde:ferredoxin oxidoreductase